jgi:L,D-transpeptidase catalytic domain
VLAVRLTSAALSLAASLVILSPGVTAYAASVPFWGAKASVAADTPIGELKHGEFLWLGDVVTSGPVVMVVSVTEQKAYVYRNGVLIGVTTVSTGRPGHLTPTGVFTILQKQKEHRSTIYDGAPMPYMERLTWGGIALHAGGLPGFPESHGCVHLPSEFARLLYGISSDGMTVVIGDDSSEPAPVAHPGYLAPVSVDGKPIERSGIPLAASGRWNPELSPSGPVSIVLSPVSRRIVVYRNGIEIGRSPLTVVGDGPIDTHALVLVQGASVGPDPYVPDPTRFRWVRIGIPGQASAAGTELSPEAIARIKIPESFVNRLYTVLAPGTTVLVTDAPVTRATTGVPLQVINADPPRQPASSRQ